MHKEKAIENYLNQLVPTSDWLTTSKVRHFYYRCLKKINALVKPETIDKKDQKVTTIYKTKFPRIFIEIHLGTSELFIGLLGPQKTICTKRWVYRTICCCYAWRFKTKVITISGNAQGCLYIISFSIVTKKSETGKFLRNRKFLVALEC